MKINKRLIWGILIVILLGAGGYVYLSSGTEEAETITAETTESFIGDLDATATASGQLAAQVKASLSLPQSGNIAEIMVTEGTQVTAGDVLLTLDTIDLERAVLDAQQALIIQESNLAELTEPAAEIERLAAEANVERVQAQLDELLSGGSEETIAAQEASVRAAQAALSAASARLATANSGGTAEELIAAQNVLENAQSAYATAEERHRSTYDCDWNESTGSFDCIDGSDNENARANAQQALADLRSAEQRVADLQPGGDTLSIASSQSSVTSAQASLRIEEARLAQLLGDASDSDIASAEAAVARAKKDLETVTEGADPFQVQQQEAQVAQARISLERAQNALADATLVAPFDGLITAVNVNVGEMASGVLIEVVSENSLEVVLDVDEIDLGSLEIGQAAIVSFETYPGNEIPAEVVSIAPENSANSAGTIVYEVNLALADNDLFLLEGMTADARLITDQREGILLVSNEAIKSNRSEGTYTVDVVTSRDEEGNLVVEETAVTVGLRDGSFTEITGGIEADTELAVGYNPPPSINFGPGGDDDDD